MPERKCFKPAENEYATKTKYTEEYIILLKLTL